MTEIEKNQNEPRRAQPVTKKNNLSSEISDDSSEKISDDIVQDSENTETDPTLQRRPQFRLKENNKRRYS